MVESPASPVRPQPGEARDDRGLARHQRLRRAREFQETFAGGRHVVGRLMVLWVRRGVNASLRLGLVSSRRAMRRAVDRNRARRLLREAYRLNRWRFREPVDVVLVARGRMRSAALREVERELLKLARRAGLLGGGRRTHTETEARQA